MNYTVTYTPVRKSIIDKDNLLRLKLEQDVYKRQKEAHAVYKIRNIALVNTEILDAYLEAFRE